MRLFFFYGSVHFGMVSPTTFGTLVNTWTTGVRFRLSKCKKVPDTFFEDLGSHSPMRLDNLMFGGLACTWQSRTRNDNSVQRTNGHSKCVAYFRWVSLIFYSSGIVFEQLRFAPCWEIFDTCQFE